MCTELQKEIKQVVHGFSVWRADSWCTLCFLLLLVAQDNMAVLLQAVALYDLERFSYVATPTYIYREHIEPEKSKISERNLYFRW